MAQTKSKAWQGELSSFSIEAMNEFLESSKFIDWREPNVLDQAKTLKSKDANLTVRQCFEFVRDEIKHSSDYACGPIVLRASDVLRHGTGYCFAKSHLFAALVRANDIPTALCYQRLSLGNGEFCLHGLNAVYTAENYWYRLDPRGNKAGVDAQFCPPVERLAFQVSALGELDSTRRYSSPLPEVVDAFRVSHTVTELDAALPDVLSI